VASTHKPAAGAPKRLIIKRMVIADPREPTKSLLEKAKARGVDSSLDSVSSIRADFLITARVLAKLGALDPSWQAKLPPGKPSTADELNEIVFHERGITNEELLTRLAPYAATVQRGTIIGSRTASLQSIELMEEAGVVIGSGNSLHTADNALRQEISRLAEGIKQDIVRTGMEKTGVYPTRSMPNDFDLTEKLMQRWFKQKGICALCDRALPLKPVNKLLQVSPDRSDSANKAYDWQNTRLTHLACNL